MKLIISTFSRKLLLIGLLLLCQALVYSQDEQDSITAATRAAIENLEADTATVADQLVADDSIVLRRVPDSVMKSLKSERDFEYANDPEYWVKQKSQDNESNSTWLGRLFAQDWFDNLLLVIMVGILLFAIIKIAVSNNLFMKRGPRKYDMTGEMEMTEDDNLQELIASAERQGNYRLAVRYRYRSTLKSMNERQLIRLDPKKTNWDYVKGLGTHPLKKQFLLLTRAYEYVWYGEFDINQQQYGYLKTEFDQFKNSL